MIGDILGYSENIVYDTSKPDGTPRRLLDVSRRERLGWHARIGLREALAQTYLWYLENEASS